MNPSTHGLWAKTAPAAPQTKALSEVIAVDTVIIGAGFTGLSAALHLAREGQKTAVLEAEVPGFGGSGRNSGLVNAGMWVMPEEVPARLGPVYGPRLLSLLGHAPYAVYELVRHYQIACEVAHKGTLHLAADEEGLANLVERERQWRALGTQVECLDAAETKLRVGSGAYHGALLDKRAGPIQPLAYARGLARAAMAEGAAIYTATPALSVQRQGAVWRVATPAGAVLARSIIVATNVYTKAPWPQLRQEIMALPYFNFATRPLGDLLRRTILPGGEGAWDTKKILTSFRMDQTGRLIFGSVGALANGGRATHEAWAKRSIARLFPQLGKVEIEEGWHGHIGMTTNSLPRLHMLEENVISISGYNGRGIAPGTVFGRAMADYISGQCKIEDLPLAVSTPDTQSLLALREPYYQFGAQIAHFATARG
jgi:glycine/D-amino acid oxidase-like deaminating enzyme